MLTGTTAMYGQGAKNIVINEVQTNNATGLVDGFGERHAWVELENTSYTTYNVRGMYLTTDRWVLTPHLKAPDRISKMSMIPNGDARTNLGAHQHLVLFGNTTANKGKQYLNLPIPKDGPVWVALYNANGTELIDSVTVPALREDQSYARLDGQWQVVEREGVTPGIENESGFVNGVNKKSKIDQFKENDPNGIAMAIMAMGIVFLCLALLWLFFAVFGLIMRHIETAKKVVNTPPIKPITKTVEKTAEIGRKASNILQDGIEKKGVDMEIYLAVIGMALKQYEDDVHDVESGIITIKSKQTGWDDEYQQMTQFHNPVSPGTHPQQQIPTNPEK